MSEISCVTKVTFFNHPTPKCDYFDLIIADLLPFQFKNILSLDKVTTLYTYLELDSSISM